jgi:hypothetical protein
VGPKFYAARDRVQPAAGRVKDAASTGWGSTIAALAPLAAAATDQARKANKQGEKAKDRNVKQLQKKSGKLQKTTNKALGRKQAKPRAGKLAGLLVAGAAVGAGAAYVLRRRQRQQWDEYDPSRPIGAADQAGNETPATGGLTASDAAFQPSTPLTSTTQTSTPQASTTQSFGDRGLSVGDENVDQTSSALHSPTVARMASGKESN